MKSCNNALRTKKKKEREEIFEKETLKRQRERQEVEEEVKEGGCRWIDIKKNYRKRKKENEKEKNSLFVNFSSSTSTHSERIIKIIIKQ